MIAVDTNVLARLLLRDDAKQHAKAHQLFLKFAEEPGSIWVSDVVLAELVWVLTAAAGCTRSEAGEALRALAENTTVQFESPAAVRLAIERYAAGPADFADCLLSVQAQAVAAAATYTFDRKMKSLPGVVIL